MQQTPRNEDAVATIVVGTATTRVGGDIAALEVIDITFVQRDDLVTGCPCKEAVLPMVIIECSIVCAGCNTDHEMHIIANRRVVIDILKDVLDKISRKWNVELLETCG